MTQQSNEALKVYIDRIERLESEKAILADDIKECYAEAKGTGLDVKIMRKLVSVRKLGSAERKEAEDLLATYMHAMGMV